MGDRGGPHRATARRDERRAVGPVEDAGGHERGVLAEAVPDGVPGGRREARGLEDAQRQCVRRELGIVGRHELGLGRRDEQLADLDSGVGRDLVNDRECRMPEPCSANANRKGPLPRERQHEVGPGHACSVARRRRLVADPGAADDGLDLGARCAKRHAVGERLGGG